MNPNHVAIGENYRLLSENEKLNKYDETICISEIKNFEAAYQWKSVEDWINCHGKLIKDVLKDDADGWERLFRRRK